ncbi:hypothetical protein PO909_006146 [Leuciscus waleckii]
MPEKKKREPMDMIKQNALYVETVKKENRNQTLFTKFHINYKKLNILTDKPNTPPKEGEEEDPAVLLAVQRARMEPEKKYPKPQTSSQEIGWISTPLLASDCGDRRFNFSRQNTDITSYMEAVWKS